MELQNPMRVVTSAVDGEVLAVLARAEHEFTVSTLETMIGSRSAPGIRKALARLVEQGIVRRRTVGRTHAYGLNRNHLGAPAVIELASLRQMLIERIRSTLELWPEPPVYAAIFGSAARATMRADSDIDLFVIRPADATAQWQADLDQLQTAITEWTGNDARALEFDVDEIGERGTTEPVIGDILRDGIPVFGDASSLRRLARAR